MIGKIASFGSVATLVVIALFFFFDVRATAESNEQELAEQKAIKEFHESRLQAVEDVLLAQDAAKEAKKEQRREWCAEGKLDEKYCPKDD